ncbi:MAG TPA: lysophospholipid acyltransferase family protein [Polyangiales bacterium]|nr:lysophospholipid acyltransferase family protein [Polyangiales bacterium]
MQESKVTAAAFPVPPTAGLFRKAVGLAMWVPGFSFLATMMGTMLVVQRFVPSDRIEWLTRFYTSGQLKVLGTRVNYVVHPEIDPKRVYVFAQNHVNMIDHCTMYAGTSHFKQGMELASHFEVPFYGWFMKQRGTIPVAKDKRAAQRLHDSVRDEVARGHSILVFPEGTRTRNGRVGPFKSGLLRIAHALELPIVPVAVTGMFEVMRKGEPYVNPGLRVTVYMDRPVETKGVPLSELPKLIESVQRTVAKRVDDFYGISGEEAVEHGVAQSRNGRDDARAVEVPSTRRA